MRDSLLSYYERELGYLRQQGTAFARLYPKVASRLELNPAQCEDPHVERLLEGVAFLAARVHLKLDDEYPEVAQALISLTAPHLLRPLPSASIARLQLGSGSAEVTEPVDCPRGLLLDARLPAGGACRFQTCFDSTVLPLAVTSAIWTTPDQMPSNLRVPGASRVLSLKLDCSEGALAAGLRLSALRFFLNGTPGLSYSLHEALLNRCLRVHVRAASAEGPPAPWLTLGPDALSFAGLEPDEFLLPPLPRAFSAYQLLQEYFAYPEKHLFVTLGQLEALGAHPHARTFEIAFSFAHGEPSGWDHAIHAELSADSLLLNCVPVVNLYPVTADPIQLDSARYDYPLVPDLRLRDQVRVFSIESVSATPIRGGPTLQLDAFHSLRHRYTGDPTGSGLFWNAVRRSREAGGESLHWLSFHDLSGARQVPDGQVITVRCLCTDGALPHSFSGAGGLIELLPAGASPVRSAFLLRKPSAPAEPPLDGATLWRLVSHLSLNTTSLASSPEPLQELLRLYAPFSADAERQISGISALHSSRQFSRIASLEGVAFARGEAIDLTLDEAAFAGAGSFLFASILERFFAAYVSVNSFTQLTARSLQRKEPLRSWPAQTGSMILI
ncbi:MAG: type VI secretion system baseplate subunit TssF [Acidobacteria bacterium]|nr:type VI secretion system baseplate subunit TssF [Acidobacteriota bacterium]